MLVNIEAFIISYTIWGALLTFIIVQYTPKPYSNYQGPCISLEAGLPASRQLTGTCCSVEGDDGGLKPFALGRMGLLKQGSIGF